MKKKLEFHHCILIIIGILVLDNTQMFQKKI